MKALAGCALALVAVSGCVGGPPRERPVLESPAVPMSQEEPSASGTAADLVGAWTSVSRKGPGSASYRRIIWILHDDGRYLCVGESDGDAKVLRGRYEWEDGTLTLVRSDGTTFRYDCRREGPVLILKDQRSELRLKPIRP